MIDLEDVGGEEIADDFIRALVNVIERQQGSIMDYDLDHGIFIRITVQSLTEEQFNASGSDKESGK